MPSSDYLAFLIKKNVCSFTALHEVLHDKNAHKYSNITVYLAEVKSMMHTEKKYSFQQFLVSQTSTQLTFLHLAARTGNLELLRDIAADFKCELSEDEYARALRIKSNLGYIPNCPPGKGDVQEIAKFLESERGKYPVKSDSRYTLFNDQPGKRPSPKDAQFSAQPGQ